MERRLNAGVKPTPPQPPATPVPTPPSPPTPKVVVQPPHNHARPHPPPPPPPPPPPASAAPQVSCASGTLEFSAPTDKRAGLVLHWPEQRLSVATAEGTGVVAPACTHDSGGWSIRARPLYVCGGCVVWCCGLTLSRLMCGGGGCSDEVVRCDETIANPTFFFTYYYFYGGSNYFHIHIDTLVPLFHLLNSRGLLDAQHPLRPPLLVPTQLNDPKKYAETVSVCVCVCVCACVCLCVGLDACVCMNVRAANTRPDLT